MLSKVDVDEFLCVTLPAIEAGDAGRLAQLVQARWRPRDLCPLLHHDDADVRRVVAVTLGLVGDRRVERCLSMALRDPDVTVNQMAEHGLWSIWFRSGSLEATRPFQAGLRLMADEDFTGAVGQFRKASAADPEFAEAYNQCAIAHFFVGLYEEALDDGLRTCRRVPVHFGAIAGMGHSFAQLGDLVKALHCYRRALCINPAMEAIAAAAGRLQERLEHANGSSGEFRVVTY